MHMIALSVIIDLLEIEGHLNSFMIIMLINLINSVKYDNVCKSTVTYTLFICCRWQRLRPLQSMSFGVVQSVPIQQEEDYKGHVFKCAMRTFQCPVCDFCNNKEANLKRHMKRCHPGLAKEEVVGKQGG